MSLFSDHYESSNLREDTFIKANFTVEGFVYILCRSPSWLTPESFKYSAHLKEFPWLGDNAELYSSQLRCHMTVKGNLLSIYLSLVCLPALVGSYFLVLVYGTRHSALAASDVHLQLGGLNSS